MRVDRPRPAIAYAVAFWSLFRALASAFSLLGEFRLYQQFFLEQASLVSFLTWSVQQGADVVLPLIAHGAGFLLLTGALLLGTWWAPLAFILGSFLTMMWNLATGIASLSLSSFLLSLVAFLVATWVFRRKQLVRFYGSVGWQEEFLAVRIGPLSLDLTLALLLLILLFLVEILNVVPHLG